MAWGTPLSFYNCIFLGHLAHCWHLTLSNYSLHIRKTLYNFQTRPLYFKFKKVSVVINEHTYGDAKQETTEEEKNEKRGD